MHAMASDGVTQPVQGVGMEVAGAQKQTARQVAKEMFLTARSRSWYVAFWLIIFSLQYAPG